MERKSMNNKGFSLVELIVVIAIMVVLMGVLAPTFSKFIERGKKSTDCQNMDSVVEALKTYAADPNADKDIDGGTITISTGTMVCTGDTDTALSEFGINDYSLKSKKWFADGKSSVMIKVVVDSKGAVSVGYVQAAADTAFCNAQDAGLKADCDILAGEYK